jgi:transcriptional regulator with XRE-family HTH domain
MTFHEKLRMRVEALGLNKARAAREAGLPESTISSYLSKDKSLPRIDIAFKIARAIGVPLDWLADDKANWPPPIPAAGVVENIQDGFLMREICRRLRLASMDVKERIEKAERIDWRNVASQILNHPDDSRYPASLESEIELASSLFFADGELRKYEASDAIKAHWRDLPPIETSPDDLDFHRLTNRLRILHDRPGCAATQLYLFLLAIDGDTPSPDAIRRARSTLRADMEKLDASADGLKAPVKSGPTPPPAKK